MKKIQKIMLICIIAFLANSLYAKIEIFSKRTFFTKTYKISKNKYRRVKCTKPFHYKNAKGEFIEIDYRNNNAEEKENLALKQYSHHDSRMIYVEQVASKMRLIDTDNYDYEVSVDDRIGQVEPAFNDSLHDQIINRGYYDLDIPIPHESQYPNCDDISVNRFYWTHWLNDYSSIDTVNIAVQFYCSDQNIPIDPEEKWNSLKVTSSNSTYYNINKTYDFNTEYDFPNYFLNTLQNYIDDDYYDMTFEIKYNYTGSIINGVYERYTEPIIYSHFEYTVNYPDLTLDGIVKGQNDNPIENVELTLSNDLENHSDITNSSGEFEFQVPSSPIGWSGTLSPSKVNYAFDPEYMVFENITTDQENIIITGDELINVSGTIHHSDNNNNYEECNITFENLQTSEIITTNPDETGFFSIKLNPFNQLGNYEINYNQGGYYPSTESIYIDNSQKDIDLGEVELTLINSNHIIVSQDETIPSFKNIKNAVIYISNENQTRAHIYLDEGVYTGENNTSVILSRGINIHGVDPQNTIIDFENTDDINRSFKIWPAEHNYGILIENITFRNSQKPFIRTMEGMGSIPICSLNISNCKFENCFTCSDYGQAGAAIYLDVANSNGIEPDISIYSNYFNNCKNSWNDYENGEQSYGGAIFMKNNSIRGKTNIENNIFDNCSAAIGGAIYCTGQNGIGIYSNTFNENEISCATNNNSYPYLHSVGLISASAILGEDLRNIKISKNIFTNNKSEKDAQTGNLGHVIALWDDDNSADYDSILVDRNTIYNNRELSGIFSIIDESSNDTSIYCFKENQIINNRRGIWSSDGYKPLIKFNNIYANNSNDYVEIAPGQSDISSDPLFTDPQNGDYTLQPNSPCIDAGDPDSNLDGSPFKINDLDKFGSRHEIGAESFPEDYDTKHFKQNNYEWVSFPRLLDNYSTDVDGYLDIMKEPVNQMDLIFEDDQASFNGEDWTNPFYLKSEKGYKIRVNGADDYNYNHKICEGDRLAPNHSFTLEAYPEENWIGYWLPENKDCDVAFGDDWDKIESIKAEDWYYSIPQDPDRRGISLPSTRIRPLEYGEGYIVVLKPGCAPIENFAWQEGETPKRGFETKSTDNFIVQEKADYEVIDVLAIDPEIDEIGVYQNDECVGAVNVDEESEQILVYSESANNRNEIPFEFKVVSDEGRGMKTVNYLKFDQKTGDFIQDNLIAGKQDYSIIKFSNGTHNDTTPEKLKLYGNYPNPFGIQTLDGRSPGTSISFDLPESQIVELNIYNIKGQLIKTLHKDMMKAGHHELYWNGKNKTGNTVSTGVYFYRLKTETNTINKKMLLIK